MTVCFSLFTVWLILSGREQSCVGLFFFDMTQSFSLCIKVTGSVIGIDLVFLGVFVPVGFFFLFVSFGLFICFDLVAG